MPASVVSASPELSPSADSNPSFTTPTIPNADPPTPMSTPQATSNSPLSTTPPTSIATPQNPVSTATPAPASTLSTPKPQQPSEPESMPPSTPAFTATAYTPTMYTSQPTQPVTQPEPAPTSIDWSLTHEPETVSPSSSCYWTDHVCNGTTRLTFTPPTVTITAIATATATAPPSTTYETTFQKRTVSPTVDGVSAQHISSSPTPSLIDKPPQDPDLPRESAVQISNEGFGQAKGGKVMSHFIIPILIFVVIFTFLIERRIRGVVGGVTQNMRVERRRARRL
ncbi:hypothetical protein PMZ80_000078 [Knufia obscura]|uniref:Uncharacterized protein n=1 Tax=Knufia obscura TaxID=1635080 RepID=A0ABR0S0S0_9EURO|nr:hypothetical protein PMZ80_000078 [Knufia obscura]